MYDPSDPSYPYAAVDVSCQACVDTGSMQTMHQHPQRSYSVPYGQMEVPQQVMPPYPVGNVLLQQPLQQLPAYPQYQEQLPWAVAGPGLAPQKLVLPDLYPIMQYPQPTYQHYNIVYPQLPWVIAPHRLAPQKLVLPDLHPIMQYPQPTYQHYNIVYPQLPWVIAPHRLAPQKLMLPDLYPIMQYPQPTYQHYSIVYPQLPWAVAGPGLAPQKLVLPDLYPIMQYPQPTYQHYNIVYPQVIQQPYPICQPVYPVIDNKQQDQRRNSLSNRPSKRNSVSGSARATPSNEEKVNYDESSRNNEIAAKIQQIKTQMAQLDTRDCRFDKEKRGEWRRRNSGSGILGNCPVGSFNNRVMGRGSNDDKHLSTAARAIVDTIRNMQAKNTYHDNRRDYQRHEHKYDRPDRHTDYRRRDRDDNKDNSAPHTRPDAQSERYDARRGLNVPVYRQPYLLRQMTPGTWCRRSPGPVHPVLNPPRRPHPDTRNPRR
ncbi:hypothetical protein PYW07_011636 [Mythimna separata]|uniref:Uncharacterized protein n=1 Tax=Mythimna separata TaxID=271217 RepID=A0AAD7Y6N6_MYTSE|nr:hypothetical protein PYW07_011636 [Mythimna separata]